MKFFGNGCCRFDGFKATHKGYKEEHVCKTLCAKDQHCIAADIARPKNGNSPTGPIKLYDCYTFSGSGKNFKAACGKKASDKCFKNKR